MEINNALLAAVTSLSAVIAILYHNIMARMKDTDAKLIECERDRRAMWREISRMGGKSPRTMDHLEPKELL